MTEPDRTWSCTIILLLSPNYTADKCPDQDISDFILIVTHFLHQINTGGHLTYFFTSWTRVGPSLLCRHSANYLLTPKNSFNNGVFLIPTKTNKFNSLLDTFYELSSLKLPNNKITDKNWQKICSKFYCPFIWDWCGSWEITVRD